MIECPVHGYMFPDYAMLKDYERCNRFLCTFCSRECENHGRSVSHEQRLKIRIDEDKAEVKRLESRRKEAMKLIAKIKNMVGVAGFVLVDGCLEDGFKETKIEHYDRLDEVKNRLASREEYWALLRKHGFVK